MDQVQALQMAWFSVTPPASAFDIYRRFFGAEPEGYQTNRNVGVTSPYLSTATGLFRELGVQVGIQPGRVEVTLQPSAPASGEDPAWDFVDREVVLAAAFELGASISVDGVVRQAAIMSMIEAQATNEEANASAQKAAGVGVPFDDGLDTVFQINRRTNATRGPGPLNRLIRIGVSHMQQVMITPGEHVLPITKNLFGLSMTVDVNNVPASQPYDSDTQQSLMIELLQEANRMAIDGTIEALK